VNVTRARGLIAVSLCVTCWCLKLSQTSCLSFLLHTHTHTHSGPQMENLILSFLSFCHHSCLTFFYGHVLVSEISVALQLSSALKTNWLAYLSRKVEDLHDYLSCDEDNWLWHLRVSKVHSFSQWFTSPLGVLEDQTHLGIQYILVNRPVEN